MSWLWLVSVGVSDVQLPIWSVDDYGRWTKQWRYEVPRAGVRNIHTGLLRMLRNGKIRFEEAYPERLDREVSRDLRLEFLQENDDFAIDIQPDEFRINLHADTDTNEEKLSLFCPKVSALLTEARRLFGDDDVQVLVLNTTREAECEDGRSEPIGAGPLVSSYLAEALDLTWVDHDSQGSSGLGSQNISTWINVLQGSERLEDLNAQTLAVARLSNAIEDWSLNISENARIAVTTSGGMPPLKPLFERIPAIWVGQEQVHLLDKPERGDLVSTPLNYNVRLPERESLRFHCVESLRAGDYVGAYGLAQRASKQEWAKRVMRVLGQLLELPGKVWVVDPVALAAARIETRLCMGDVSGALIRIGTLLELLTWELIIRDERISESSLEVDRDKQRLKRCSGIDEKLLPKHLIEKRQREVDTYLVKNLRAWPRWLKDRAGGQLATANHLYKLAGRYDRRPRGVRNALIHEAQKVVTPGSVRQTLEERHVVRGVRKPFGRNFLADKDVDGLLVGLESKRNIRFIKKQIHQLLDEVIKGYR